ncbi:DUF6888 family protein [Nostoc sp.]
MYAVCSFTNKRYKVLVIFDERTNNIVVIAGEETVVVINPEAEVDYE